LKYPNLRAEIARRGYTLNDFGKIIGVSPGAISLKLNGKRDFDIVEVKKICEHFNMSFEQLFL
jgi:transcriptional regulator with XRE-family HTH domain